MPCNRQELINELREMSEQAQDINEHAAASVLLALCGALSAGAELELVDVCAVHSRIVLARIQAERAESEEWPDTVNVPA